MVVLPQNFGPALAAELRAGYDYCPGGSQLKFYLLFDKAAVIHRECFIIHCKYRNSYDFQYKIPKIFNEKFPKFSIAGCPEVRSGVRRGVSDIGHLYGNERMLSRVKY